MREIRIPGVPSPRQAEFFASEARYTAYGGARGGGKSWALRRRLVAICLRYTGCTCLLVRRSYGELKGNHVLPLLREYGGFLSYHEGEKAILFPNGSSIRLGFCASDRDVLRYQGQEYDVIAIDEATQLSEYQFSIFKACLRGTGAVPRRMLLTCNPGGIGHAWVKRLFIDRIYREGERGEDYRFIPARVYDNRVLLEADPDYVRQLESLPTRLREAWLEGRWDVFEGQFFPEFDEAVHVCERGEIPRERVQFVAFDYGFDMLAAVLMAYDAAGRLYAVREFCAPGLTLSEAGEAVARLCAGELVRYAVASPDLWNRRQDSGRSGFEIMQGIRGMPPMVAADDRRVPGWRVLRELLGERGGEVRLRICRDCRELIRCLPALLCDKVRPEDAAGEPHAITHAPEALRYAVMSRPPLPEREEANPFIFPKRGDGGRNYWS